VVLLRTWTLPPLTDSSICSPKDLQLAPPLATMRLAATSAFTIEKPPASIAALHFSNSGASGNAKCRIAS
jgi:hypothetical protein